MYLRPKRKRLPLPLQMQLSGKPKTFFCFFYCISESALNLQHIEKDWAIDSNISGYVRIHWRLSTILKTSNKSVRSNAFWYLKVCISWKCIHYTMHWELQLITVLLLSCELIWAEAQGSSLTRVPKVPFRFFDKLKYEIRNKVLIFVSILKLRDET